MNDFDKLLLAIIGLALIAVVIGTTQTAQAISTIGAAIKKLTENVLGVQQQ